MAEEFGAAWKLDFGLRNWLGAWKMPENHRFQMVSKRITRISSINLQLPSPKDLPDLVRPPGWEGPRIEAQMTVPQLRRSLRERGMDDSGLEPSEAA